MRSTLKCETFKTSISIPQFSAGAPLSDRIQVSKLLPGEFILIE